MDDNRDFEGDLEEPEIDSLDTGEDLLLGLDDDDLPEEDEDKKRLEEFFQSDEDGDLGGFPEF
jgi:hypothetical protein